MTVEFFEDFEITRREMAGHPHRPLYHFLPPRNWMNDPNGLFYWQGKYHLFYQFNPYGPLWGFIHWGHASSEDLVHWQDHPIALTPEEGAGDDNGCFSGCMVNDTGVPTAVYTGFVSFFDTPVLIARAQDPDLIRWQKSPANPVVAEKPEGVNDTDFRDPYVWRQEERWQMVIGAGMTDGDSAALLYESPDLLSWNYLGPLFKHQTFDSVTMWECPNFFKLGDSYVLLVSLFPNAQGVYYYVGDYDGKRFSPHTQGSLAQDSIFYAPQVRQLGDGRTILFAWLLEGRSDEAIETAGWAGVQAIPRQLALDEAGHLISKPVEKLEQLRQAAHHFKDIHLDPDHPYVVPVKGSYLEIEAEFEIEAAAIGVGVLGAPDGSEVTRIGWDMDKREAWLDTTQSSLSGDVKTGVQKVKLQGNRTDRAQLHVLVDGSVIEVWFNNSVSITARVYPTRLDSEGIFFFVDGLEGQVPSLDVWEMEAIWPAELPDVG
jgi:beta-fructofuranosidase